MQQILELQEMENEYGGHEEEAVIANSSLSGFNCGSDVSLILC